MSHLIDLVNARVRSSGLSRLYTVIQVACTSSYTTVVSYSLVHMVKQVYFDCIVVPHKGNAPFNFVHFIQ